MNIIRRMPSLLCCLLLGSVFHFNANAATDSQLNDSSEEYLLGAGIADVTGPALGNFMWGFSKPGQNTEGIHTRLKSRAFIFVDPVSNKRLLFASVDLGIIEHHVLLEVLDKLRHKYGDLYRLDNTILSATHTHAGPAGYKHFRVSYGIAGKFYKDHFDRIVEGIVASIETAHNNLQPGNILINKGEVQGAGANRSMTAYNANPKSERALYDQPMDLDMTLLRLQGKSAPFALLNWFSVHPTSMTYDNRLISGDHKGFAALKWEQKQGVKYQSNGDFVAAFAQSTPGDVTPNLNLNNTGPGETDIESTQIIGQRQLSVAETLFETAHEKLIGPIDSRQIYVDLSNFKVKDEFTHAGDQVTCPSAYGYAFAAGSTEDGGGHFLFSEGMKDQSWWLDQIIYWVTNTPPWTQAVKDCQAPKAIIFETGSGPIPVQTQIRSVSIARLGSLAIVAMPAEITTMSARRLRKTVMAQLGSWAKHIVIAGYANGSAGYITTPEEFETQQYEGGHTLHGKWSLPAFQQILTGLAQSLESKQALTQQVVFDDWRGKSTSHDLTAGMLDSLPQGIVFGDVFDEPEVNSIFKIGDQVSVTFWSGNPSTGYRTGNKYAKVERQENGVWQEIHSDMDWSTMVRWQQKADALVAQVEWKIPDGSKAGLYRIKHLGNYRKKLNAFSEFEAVSRVFRVAEPESVVAASANLDKK